MQATLERHSRQQLEKLEADLTQQLEQHRQSRLTLDLTRGKPGPEQLDLSNPLDGILQGRYHADNGDDLRNYGGIEGIPEARALFAKIMGVDQTEILVGVLQRFPAQRAGEADRVAGAPLSDPRGKRDSSAADPEP